MQTRTDSPRVLLVVPYLEMGGAERQNLDLLDEFARHGWNSTVISTLPAAQSWYDEYAQRTPDIVLLQNEEDPTNAPELFDELLRTRRPTAVVISNSELGYLLLPRMRSQSPHMTTIDVCQSFIPGSNGGYARHSVDLAEHLDLTIVTGAHIKAWMLEQGRKDERIDVCYAGVDIDRWRPDAVLRTAVRSELGVDEDTPLIVFAGRLSAEKRPLIAAQVIKELSQSGTRVASIFLGDGPQRDELTDFVAHSGLADSVRVAGSVEPDQVRRVFAAADVCLLTSQYEGISITLIEAMASGVSVVAPDVGGHRELVREGGILVPQEPKRNEIDRYVYAVSSVIASREQRSAMGLRGRDEVISTFDAINTRDRLWQSVRRASELHVTAPRAPATPEQVHRSTQAAVLYLRLLEPPPIVRRVPFGTRKRRIPASERLYRAVRLAGRPVYLWARRRWAVLDRVNEAMKRLFVR